MQRCDHSAADEQAQLDLFQAVDAGYARAEQAAGGAIERCYRIGRDRVLFRFAGQALISVVEPALEHLISNPVASPELTVCLWDQASAQGRNSILLDGLMRVLSWHWHLYLDPRGEIRGYNGRRFRSAFHPGPNILSILDHERKRAVYWAADAHTVPWHETGSPMRAILSWWAAARGYQFVHGGAVGHAGAAVLIVGKGGSGKSTTTLACLQAGFSYLGDDYTLVSTQPVPKVYSLYNTAKLKGAADLLRFPDLVPCLSNADRLETEKAMMFLARHCPDQVVSELALSAILIPKIVGGSDTRLTPAGASAALAALAPSTLLQLAGASRDALKRMADLVKRIPCYELALGTDIEQIPLVILGLLSGCKA